MIYLKFNKLIRFLIVEVNFGIAYIKVNLFFGVIWSDYKRKKGKDISFLNILSFKVFSKVKK